MVKKQLFQSKTIAYLRVSTNDQDLEKNKSDILFLGNEKNLGKIHFVEEKISGKVSWKKRKLAEILEELKEGDNLIVSELSRLGRSMLECMEILSIATQKGIRIFAVKGNWQLDGSLQSKIVAMAFSIAAEIERDLISSRTKEALRYRKESGQKLGRPVGPGKSKLDKFRPEIEALLKNGSTQTFIANRYGCRLATLNAWVKRHKII
jgi:DNA invertase Pin-like site-specific DNA recombinase